MSDEEEKSFEIIIIMFSMGLEVFHFFKCWSRVQGINWIVKMTISDLRVFKFQFFFFELLRTEHPKTCSLPHS